MRKGRRMNYDINTIKRGIVEALMKTGYVDRVIPSKLGRYTAEIVSGVETDTVSMLAEILMAVSIGDRTQDLCGVYRVETDTDDMWYTVARWNGVSLLKTYISQKELEDAFEKRPSWYLKAWLLCKNGFSPNELAHWGVDFFDELFQLLTDEGNYPYLAPRRVEDLD